MKHNWCIHPGVFNNQNIDKIVKFIESNYTLQPGRLGVGNNVFDENVRGCDVAWVGLTGQDVFIRNFLWDHIKLVNSEAFGFDIQLLEPVQYTVYNGESSDHYTWHRDTYFTSDKVYDRKITLVMQLSDGDEYEGGDLLLEDDFTPIKPDQKELRTKGTILVFPSFVKHTVTPVTKGIRRTLVAWAIGPHFR